MSVKAPRLLTHVRRLYAPERWLARIERGVSRLGERRGVLLVQLSLDVTAAVVALPGVTGVEVDLGVMSAEQRSGLHETLRGGQAQREIPFAQPGSLTKVFAIASGKGGVGKSSVTVNLAAAMAKQGLKVGIVDADIYGHSIPAMLGVGGLCATPGDLVKWTHALHTGERLQADAERLARRLSGSAVSLVLDTAYVHPGDAGVPVHRDRAWSRRVDCVAWRVDIAPVRGDRTCR